MSVVGCCANGPEVLEKECIACIDRFNWVSIARIIKHNKCKLLRYSLNSFRGNKNGLIGYCKTFDRECCETLKILLESGIKMMPEHIYRCIKKAKCKDIFYTLESFGINFKNTVIKRDLMIYAADAGKPFFLEYLIEKKYPINVCDSAGMTPLMHATQNGYIQIIMMLLENNADHSIIDNYGKTILHHAVSSQTLDATDLIYSIDKTNLNKKDLDGFTPLHLSVYYNISICEYLLGIPEIELLENNYGDTPIDHAEMYGYYEKAQVMVDKLFTPIIIII